MKKIEAFAQKEAKKEGSKGEFDFLLR